MFTFPPEERHWRTLVTPLGNNRYVICNESGIILWEVKGSRPKFLKVEFFNWDCKLDLEINLKTLTEYIDSREN